MEQTEGIMTQNLDRIQVIMAAPIRWASVGKLRLSISVFLLKPTICETDL